MDVFRCVICGSSEQEGGKWTGCFKCAKCGAAMGPRSERCQLSEETVRKLVPHQKELEKFGVQFRNEASLQKGWGEQLDHFASALFILEKLRPGTVQDLVRFLKNLHIPYDEILRLRLDEPEVVKDLYGKDRTLH